MLILDLRKTEIVEGSSLFSVGCAATRKSPARSGGRKAVLEAARRRALRHFTEAGSSGSGQQCVPESSSLLALTHRKQRRTIGNM
jgi:hypothetical protein